ncbi:pentatricopeptide repeat (PPR) superfamily protein [Striga asiatica]|uniref:Pentatricopeptide repeat (PPR) superfamily protein n=1 Tax=Striga asiatica TaxID=4170 RepID=A0A5A7P3T6_STRAF|nr:pentatricopeptide repeat (PPR) superfamily protein [Striga asiatica]
MRDASTFHGDPFIYASLIKACNKARALIQGKSVHGHVVRVGLDYNVNVLNSLVSFYMGPANSMSYAALLFDEIPEKSIVTVNCMISGNINRGNLDVGLSLFVEMFSGCYGSNVKPNYVTFVILISGCVQLGGLRSGNALHCCCSKMGFGFNLEICNALIDLYAKSRRIFDAESVFRCMPKRDVISWNSMILGYGNSGDFVRAFSLFRKMWVENVGADKVSFSSLLSACKDLSFGRMIHARAKVSGLDCDVSVGTALMNMYARCRNLGYARKVFDEMPKQKIEFWNSMIHSYIEHGLAHESLKLLDKIKLRELELDEVTILGLIMACRDTGDLRMGIHAHSIVESKECFKRSVVLGNALIDMYAKCGSITKARAIFNGMSIKDVVSWTSMIVGHAVNGEGNESLSIFKRMCEEKYVPNSVTFIGVLSACDHAGLVDEGRKFYDLMQETYHIKPKIEHCGCVVDMLARAGKFEDAQSFIRQMPIEPNALVWRMLMNGCRVHGQINLGLNLDDKSVRELKESREPTNFVVSSNMYAEAGRWGDFMVDERTCKEAGKSILVSSLIE